MQANLRYTGLSKKTQERKQKAAMNDNCTWTKKAKAQEQYTEAKRMAKESIKTDKKYYVKQR